MNLFGNKSEEKALATLIHDTNSSLGTLKWYTKKLEEWLREHTKSCKEKGIDVSSIPFVAVEYLKRDAKAIQETIDIYYKKLAETTKE